MEKYYNECLQKLEEKINELTLEVDDHSFEVLIIYFT